MGYIKMESSDSVSIKKQRNAKIRRDNRKNTFHKKNSDNEAGQPNSEPDQNPASTPQPQRANNRQRIDPTPKNGCAEKCNKVVPEEVKETVMVDHSNLKRETEEIVKLTKKFSKREVTSNWHRYATAENVTSEEQLKDEAPADFTDLLQVPVSRGGHLQLKEEQEWSSAVPRGYWALDLKQLSFSLACIPTHQRLRLPMDMLSEEEIQRYVFLAEEAKKYYEASECADLKDDVGYREKPFNILDVEKSTDTLVNMDLGLEESLNNKLISKTDTLEKAGSNANNEIKLNIKQDSVIENIQGPPRINELLTSNPIDASNKTNSVNIETDKYNIKTEGEVSLDVKLEDNTLAVNQQQASKNQLEKKPTNNKLSSYSEISDLGGENGTGNNSDPINNYEIKEKREKRTNRLPVKQELDSKTEENTNEIKFEDEDDLDFLLSLKKPILSEKPKEYKPATLKDSSFLPGTTISSSTSPAQHTDLDDWLDSVLED